MIRRASAASSGWGKRAAGGGGCPPLGRFLDGLSSRKDEGVRVAEDIGKNVLQRAVRPSVASRGTRASFARVALGAAAVQNGTDGADPRATGSRSAPRLPLCNPPTDFCR